MRLQKLIAQCLRTAVLGGVIALCACDDSTIHISTGPGVDASVHIDSAPVAPAQHPVGIPVGPFNLPSGEFVKPYYSGSYRYLTPDSADLVMSQAQDNFFDLYVNLAGPRENIQNPDGTFCLACFKARLDLFVGVELEAFAQSSTVRGHIMFEEPENPALWGGSPVPYEDIDSAAAYSHQLFPHLPAGVGGPPTFLVGGAPYAKLNFAFAEYSTDNGGVGNFLTEELAAGSTSGLGVLFGFDALTGNFGQPMTAYQILHWGKKIACEPRALGLLMRQYDPTFFADSAMQTAMRSVVKLATYGAYRDIECGKVSD